MFESRAVRSHERQRGARTHEHASDQQSAASGRARDDCGHRKGKCGEVGGSREKDARQCEWIAALEIEQRCPEQDRERRGVHAPLFRPSGRRQEQRDALGHQRSIPELTGYQRDQQNDRGRRNRVRQCEAAISANRANHRPDRRREEGNPAREVGRIGFERRPERVHLGSQCGRQDEEGNRARRTPAPDATSSCGPRDAPSARAG